MNSIEVLLVEDNTGDLMVIWQALYSCPMPVTLHIVCDGEQALLMLTNPHVQLNLIILDLNIPKVTGTALLQRWGWGRYQSLSLALPQTRWKKKDPWRLVPASSFQSPSTLTYSARRFVGW